MRRVSACAELVHHCRASAVVTRKSDPHGGIEMTSKEEKREAYLAEQEEAEAESNLVEMQRRGKAMMQLHEQGGVQLPFIDPKPFASLLSHEGDLKKVFAKLEEVLWTSFAMDIRMKYGSGKPTGAEIQRRFKICEEWFRRARAELGFSLEKTLDLMNHALRAALDGLPFDPDNPE